MTLQSTLLACAALVLVLGLVWLAQRAARWGGLAPARGPAQGNRISLIQGLALDPRRRLHLIRCDDREVLLLTGGGQDVVVGWLERGDRE